jgi:hypothetical protein
MPDLPLNGGIAVMPSATGIAAGQVSTRQDHLEKKGK